MSENRHQRNLCSCAHRHTDTQIAVTFPETLQMNHMALFFSTRHMPCLQGPFAGKHRASGSADSEGSGGHMPCQGCCSSPCHAVAAGCITHASAPSTFWPRHHPHGDCSKHCHISLTSAAEAATTAAAAAATSAATPAAPTATAAVTDV